MGEFQNYMHSGSESIYDKQTNKMHKVRSLRGPNELSKKKRIPISKGLQLGPIL